MLTTFQKIGKNTHGQLELLTSILTKLSIEKMFFSEANCQNLKIIRQQFSFSNILKSKHEVDLCMLHNIRQSFHPIFYHFFYHDLLPSADFFQNKLSQKTILRALSECQTIWIQIITDILSVLIWVQTVCKGYQIIRKS